MRLEDGQPQIVDFEDKKYIVFREDMDKGSNYLFVECGVASKELMEAYFDELYKKES